MKRGGTNTITPEPKKVKKEGWKLEAQQARKVVLHDQRGEARAKTDLMQTLTK
jgi:hypothetical protein